MNTWLVLLEKIFLTIWEISWQASLIALAVLAVQATLGRWLNPRWKSALWLLVLIRLLLPVLPQTNWSAHQFAPAPVPTEAATVTTTTEIPPVSHLPALLPGWNLIQTLAAVWLAGVVIWGLTLLWVNLRFSRFVRSLPELADPGLSLILHDSCLRLGIDRCPRLVETDRVGSPAVMGLWHPTLLLPQGTASRFTPDELRLVFLHELAHLRRGDHLIQCLIAVLHVLHWFNPLLAWTFHRMRLDREPATDAMVLTRAGESNRESYGFALLKVLETHQTRHALPLLVGILEDKSQLKSRFRLIHLFTQKAYAWSALGVGLIVLLAVFGLTRPPAKTPDHPSMTPAIATPNPTPNIMPAPEATRTWKQKMEETLIDLSVQDMPAGRALAEVARLSAAKGFAVEIDKLPASEILPVTLELKDVSVDAALSFLCTITNLKRNDIIREGKDPLIQFVPLKAPALSAEEKTRAWKQKLEETRIDLSLQEVPVDRALAEVARLSASKGFPIQIDFKLPASGMPPVTVHLKDVPVDSAISFLCKMSNLRRIEVSHEGVVPLIRFIPQEPNLTPKPDKKPEWNSKLEQTRIDLSVQDVPVEQAFAEVARLAAAKGLVVKFDNKLPVTEHARVTAKLNNVSVEMALSHLSRLSNISYVLISREEGPVIQFTSKEQALTPKPDSTRTWKQKLEQTQIDMVVQDMPVDVAFAEVARLSAAKGLAIQIDLKLLPSGLPPVMLNWKDISVDWAFYFLCELCNLKRIDVAREGEDPLIQIVPSKPQ